MVRRDGHGEDFDAQVLGLIDGILQATTWLLITFQGVPVCHHDQVLVLLQVGAPGKGGAQSDLPFTPGSPHKTDRGGSGHAPPPPCRVLKVNHRAEIPREGGDRQQGRRVWLCNMAFNLFHMDTPFLFLILATY